MPRTRIETFNVLAAIDGQPWITRALALVSGGVMALGLAPFQLPMLTVLALALVLRCHARARSRRQGGLLGWLLGLGYFLVALHWIVDPFLVDAPRHGWMAPFAILLMAGGLALFWGAAFWVSWGLGPRDGPRRALAAVLALSVMEMARSVVLTGFPWALIGSVWVDHPIGQLAAIVGMHGLTLFTGVLAVGVLTLSVWRASRRALLATGLTVVAWGGGTVLGEMMLSSYDVRQARGPVVRLVQPNETQNLKWQADMIPVFWSRKLELSGAEAEVAPRLVIWPEVSLPFLLKTNPAALATVSAAAHGATVIAGAQRFEGDALRNALAVIAPGGEITHVYDKYHLVPFGEYFPGGRLAEALGLRGLATSMLGGFSPGPGAALIDLGPLGKALPLICYEAIFPRHAAPRGLERPDWIVQITNDAWFGNFSGPQQHLDQARLRAIEQGLPLVRAANTGISAIIDAKGRVLAQIPLNTSGVIDHAIPAATGPTPYARAGNGPLILLILIMGIWLIRSAIVNGH